MSKTKFLTIAVIALMVLNLGLIVALILGSPPMRRPHDKDPKEIIIEKLKLNKEQISQYEKLIEKHREQIKEKEEALMSAKNSLFLLLQAKDYNQRDSLVNQIGMIQAEIEQINFQHFADLKTLCDDKQLLLFDELTLELGKLFEPKQ
jgi:periplasmic protein CpxP/Spy